jgi:transcriptional regulator with XRE-family HTH domain
VSILKIKELCTQKGIDIKELSKKSGISLVYLYELERGVKNNPSIHIVSKIATALNIDIRDLLNSA